MGRLADSFRKIKYRFFSSGSVKQQPVPPEYLRLEACRKKMEDLLREDRYLARRDFTDLQKEAKEAAADFRVLADTGMLEDYCRKNHLNFRETKRALQWLDKLDYAAERHNKAWLPAAMKRDREYLDHILDAVDPGIRLDEDQRRVVLSEEDYTLVIAGAGAGKTTTVAAKVKYLVEREGADPSDILIVSFTNKAVEELRERINRKLGIGCPVTTFHSAGYAILRMQTDEKKRVVDKGVMYAVLRDYFCKTVLQNESVTNRLILFFASYFDAPYEGGDLNDFFRRMSRQSLTTLRSELNEYTREILDSRSHKKITIQNEILRSFQEVEIANFLYMNGIEYEYEPVYPYDIRESGKPYTPDFLLSQEGHTAYLEHFGMTEDGKNSRYSAAELEKYKKAAARKINLHRLHGTELLYTFSSYRDGRTLEEHLKEELEGHGFRLVPRPSREVLEKLVAGEESRYIRKLLLLVCRFLSNFKVNGYTASEFDRMIRSTENVRSQLFLEITHDCYLEYEKFLKEKNCIDFEDMINDSVRILKEAKEMKQRLHFRYIIVDEYQDISRQRFDLTRAIAEVTDAKIMAVGDDWQSIYAFSGSELPLFTHFRETMGYADMIRIEKTYRNAQEVIDIAGDFIQQNPEQIRKTLKSPKRISDPVIIYTYDAALKKRGGSPRSGAAYASAEAVQEALAHIRLKKEEECAGKGKKADSYGRTLLLGRYGFDGDMLSRSGLFEYDSRKNRLTCLEYPDMDITFMTVHSSKGLGYDNVILVNARNETYGFPSKIEDDPVLSFVIHGDRSIDYAEERRLFYVAMTRTYNRVYMIAPEQNPSEFLLELKKKYRNVLLKGDWNEEAQENPYRKICPVCGYPLQLRYKKAYGLRLYMCTNEPELCSFMTNEIRGGRLSIRKCDWCRDGYLVVKPGKGGRYFLGCTNYRPDGKGCGRVM